MQGGLPLPQSHQAPRRAIYSWWDSPKGMSITKPSPTLRRRRCNNARRLCVRSRPLISQINISNDEKIADNLFDMRNSAQLSLDHSLWSKWCAFVKCERTRPPPFLKFAPDDCQQQCACVWMHSLTFCTRCISHSRVKVSFSPLRAPGVSDAQIVHYNRNGDRLRRDRFRFSDRFDRFQLSSCVSSSMAKLRASCAASCAPSKCAARD